MLDNGKFCGMNVGYTEQADGGYLVILDQDQYTKFMAYRATASTKQPDMFTVSVDASKSRTF